ncbi:MAG: NYN domain-containing protein [Chloroflexi bacterium]|nr:NYN domain-containing protein [Chloroflexota bacterium]
MLMTPLKLGLFIDGQNAYKQARNAFFSPTDPFVDGQFNPVALAELIASKGGPNGDICEVEHVRIYTGQPSSARDPKGYSANRKQISQWTSLGCTAIPRPLQYPRNPMESPREKGIDVALAVDYVRFGIDRLYDIGVIFSTDTDLLPALELVRSRYSNTAVAATAAWRSPNARRRLAIQNTGIWCHWLDYSDYQRVRDETDYTR